MGQLFSGSSKQSQETSAHLFDLPLAKWRLVYMSLRTQSDLQNYMQGSNPKPNTGTLYRNDWNTPYVYESKITEYNSLVTPPPIFTTFQVIIPSLLFVGYEKEKGKRIRENITDTQVTDFMTNFIRRQIGSHLFMDRYSNLQSVRSYIELSGDYKVTSLAPIHSIYPVVRYVRDLTTKPPTGRQEPVYGLSFQRCTSDTVYEWGDRWYHRYADISDRKLEAGSVREFTESMIRGLPGVLTSRPDFSDRDCVVLFVCVGAKLIVTDECVDTKYITKNSSKIPHNRSLIQQGGMVFVQCHTIWSESRGTKGHNHSIGYDWETFVDRLVKVDGKSTDWVKLKGYKKPVIFIGPNDSNYNTIAWGLNVKLGGTAQNDNPGNTTGLYTTADVVIPEGARIVAIEDGANGVQEICDRMNYEMLHDSVLSNHGTDFRLPTNEDTIRKILNVNEERSFDYTFVNIKTPVQDYLCKSYLNDNNLYVKKPLFREFNFMKLEAPDLQFYYNRGTRLPVPPMYPPFCVLTKHEFQFIPNQRMPKEVESCYPFENKAPELQIYTFEIDYNWDKSWDNKSWCSKSWDTKSLTDSSWNSYCLLLKEHQYIDYDWVRVKDPSKQDIASVDYTKQRIGVDGWVWEMVKNQNQNSKFMTNLYAGAERQWSDCTDSYE